MSLQNKIDFAIIFTVKNANPNGDPLNGNRPRIDYAGYGEITDVCLKRKIRDRLQEIGQSIFVQSDEKKMDGMVSLKARAEHVLGKDTLNPKKTKPEDAAKLACQQWYDVRAFGQLFAFKGDSKAKKKSTDGEDGGGDNGEENANGISIPVRGPVSIQSAFSVEPVSITSTQITKSVSGDGDGSKKSSDTMGMKHRVDQAVYITYGAITPQLADRTGFSDNDADLLKLILPKLFEGDASSARPEGSMAVSKVFWWKHNSKAGQFSSAKVHASLSINPDGSYTLTDLDGLKPEIIDGF